MRFLRLTLAGLFVFALSSCTDRLPTDAATADAGADGTAVFNGSGGWDDKVTGGGDFLAGGTAFTLTASAKGDDDVSGQIEYNRADLAFHATVDCLYVTGDLTKAALGGTVQTWQTGSGNPYVLVEIHDAGGGPDSDRVRVRLFSSPPACALSGSFPGAAVDANFNIRSK